MANDAKQPKTFREAQGQQLYSAWHIERADAMLVEDESSDQSSRLVELSFASNNPIQHGFGFLELDMNPKSVRLDRLTKGGALLWNHCADHQIGVVQSVSLDKGKAKATCKFSRSECGEENYQDVLDGIKQNVSVGFIPYTIEQKVDKNGKQIFENGEPVYISRDWEPFEISLVSIPADISVGVGRSLTNFEEQKRMETTNPTTTETALPPVAQIGAIDTRSESEKRDDLFLSMGKRFEQEALAQRFALEGKTEAELRAAILAAKQADQVTVPPAAPENVAQRSGQQIQLARTLPRFGSVRNFKGEKSEENAYRFGQWFMAVAGMARAIEFCKENGLALRAHQEGTNEKGGFLVPDEFGNDLIDLREQFGVFRRNAKIVPMASDTRSDPRRTGGLTAYFVGESEAGTNSDKSWDRVGLIAKKLMVLARYSSELNEDSAISIGDDLMGEIAYAFAYKEDLCGFNGDGSSTYGSIVGVREKLKGLSGTIANISGLFVGTGNAYSELTLADFEAVVGLLPQYADTPRAKWFVHRSFYYNVMVKVMLASGGVTAAEVEGARNKRFLGYDVEFSQVLPKAEANSQVCALLGDLSKAVNFGARRDTMISMSEHSRFSTDEIEIKGTERFDLNVHSVGNATATAADKEPGPVVGLITAAS